VAGGRDRDYKSVALGFAEALARRDYPAAWAMTSKQYQAVTTMEAMQVLFEAIVPTDWRSVGPIEIGTTLESWPGQESGDLGWVYVSIGGDVYSEAVTVVVALEDGESRIRTVEFGRP
jgi:hypothetical protein